MCVCAKYSYFLHSNDISKFIRIIAKLTFIQNFFEIHIVSEKDLVKKIKDMWKKCHIYVIYYEKPPYWVNFDNLGHFSLRI